ncbi:MAG TPA: hypothetical protein QGF86_09970 [Nitrospinaceae bacterium]|nr:hypothetical protein [Nitrospinaceae bacterium]
MELLAEMSVVDVFTGQEEENSNDKNFCTLSHISCQPVSEKALNLTFVFHRSSDQSFCRCSPGSTMKC